MLHWAWKIAPIYEMNMALGMSQQSKQTLHNALAFCYRGASIVLGENLAAQDYIYL